MAALGFERFYGRRPRPRRPRAPPHVPRPSAKGRARGHPRHHSAASSAQQHHAGVGHLLLALVLHDPALRFSRAADGRRSRLFHRKEARQDRPGPELLRPGGARRIQALFPQSRHHPRHVRGLSRDLRHRPRHGHRRILPPEARSPARCCCSGARPAASAATTSPPRSGRAMPSDIRGAKALPLRALSVRRGAGGDLCASCGNSSRQPIAEKA